ncbi:hypothetical protein HY469_01360 [Candidatus Roizmanbacteria bacterium]|nr:hypothetical protein [Candidatus Roizmanbacteria bacterium]
MSETLIPPHERRYSDYGVGWFLLTATRTMGDNPPADTVDLLPNAGTPLKRISLDEQMQRRWGLLEELAQDD